MSDFKSGINTFEDFESGLDLDEEFESGIDTDVDFESGIDPTGEVALDFAPVAPTPEEEKEEDSFWDSAYKTLIEDPDQMSITELQNDEEFLRLSETAGAALGGMDAITAIRARTSNSKEALKMAIESGAWTAEQGEAYLKLEEMFDNAELEGFSEWKDAIFEYGWQGITDPITHVAILTSILTGGQSLTAKQAAMVAANELTKAQVKRTLAKKGAAFGAVEAGSVTAAIDLATQTKDINTTDKEEYDFQQTLINTAIATTLGGSAGWIGGRYLDGRVVDKIDDDLIPNGFRVDPNVDDVIEVDGQVIPRNTEVAIRDFADQAGLELDDEIIEEAKKIDGNSLFEVKQYLRYAWSKALGKPSGALAELSKYSPTAKKLMDTMAHDMMRPLRGEREVAERTVSETVNEITGTYAVKFKQILDPLKNPLTGKLDEGMSNRIMAHLRGKELSFDGTFPDEAITKAVTDIRALMDNIHGHAKYLGIKVGYQENYVPRIWNRKAMKANPDKFIRLLVESGQAKPRVNPVTKQLQSAHDVAEEIYTEMMSKTYQAKTEYARPAFSPKRVFEDIKDDNMFQEFLDNNVEEVFMDYIFNRGHKLGITQSLGVTNMGQFQSKWIDVIRREMQEAGRSGAGRGLTEGEQRHLLMSYKLMANEGIEPLSPFIKNTKDTLALGFQMSLLPLATLSSLSEIGLLMLKATPEQVGRGIKAASGVAKDTIKYNAVTGYNNMLAKANQRMGNNMLESLQVKHNLTKPEVWDHLARFNIATTRAAQDRIEGISGTPLSSKGARRLQDGFFKVTALTDWTKFVEMTAFHVGNDIIENNLKLLARDQGVGLIGEASTPFLKPARKTRLLNELADLGIDAEEGIEWIRRGGDVSDPYIRKVQRSAARYTSDVILHPNRVTGIKPNIMNHPMYDLLFQLMSYPTAFSNVVLKQMGRSLASGDPVQTARALGTIGTMTAVATVANMVRTQGESLDKDPEEILRDSVVRWGGNGMFFDMIERSKKSGEYLGPLGYVTGAFGPVVGKTHRVAAYQQGPAEALSSMIPGYAAFDTIAGKGTRKEWTAAARKLDQELGIKDTPKGKVRLNYEEGGVVDFPGLPSDPTERRNPYTGESYSDTADRIAFVLGGLASKASKTIVPHLRHLFRPDTPEVANVRALESLAGNPLKMEDLDKPVEISFMVSNKSTPKHRQKRKGTYDRGDIHRIIPLDSFEGEELMKKYGISEDQKMNFSHMVEVDNVQLAKGESPVKTDITKDEYDDIILYTRDEVLDTYNDGYRPLYAAKNLDPESKELWRTTDDADVYYDTVPQGKVAQENLKESMAASGPLDLEVFKILSAGKDLKYAKKLTLIDEKSAEFLNENIRPVPDSIVRRVRMSEPEGIRVFHGSSADFDEFSREFDFTGEGNQAYGAGAYLTETRDIAKSYQALASFKNAKDAPEDSIARSYTDEFDMTDQDAFLEQIDMDVVATTDIPGSKMKFFEMKDGSAIVHQPSKKKEPFRAVEMPPQGTLYEARINVKEDEILDLNEKLYKSEKGRKLISDYYDETDEELLNSITGQDLIDDARGVGGTNEVEKITDEFRKAGFKVLKYKDGFSRGKEGGTYNYVVFDPKKDVTILKNNGENAFKKKFLRGSKHKERVFRAVTNDKPVYDMIIAGENPRQIGIHVADDPVQAEAILYADDVIRYVDNTTDRNLSAEARERMLAETDPEKMYGSALKEGKPITKGVKPDEFTRGDAPSPSISDYYINIKNPLLVDVDMPSGWAAQDLIPDMLGSSEFRSRLSRPTEIAEAIQKNINYGAVFGAEDAESIDLIQDYIITKARGLDTSGLVSELKSFSVDIDAVDSVVESYRVRVNKELHPLMQAIEKQLNRPISDAELEKLSEIDIPKEAYSDSARDKSLYEAAVYKANRELREWFESFGFDSIQYNNTIEAAGEGSSRKSWILFHSYQVKSTRAESFDITDPRVSKAMGGLVRNRDKYAKREEFSEGGMVPMPPEVMQPEAQEIINPPLNQSNLQAGGQSDSASVGTGLIMRSLKRRFR